MKPLPKTITLEPPLLERAKKVAKARRQSFSAYVATLIELDLLKAQQGASRKG